jgi:hypothetical protein
VHDAHRRFDLVNVLPAFAAGTKGVDLDFRRIDVDRRRIGNFRDHVHARK